VDDEVLYLQIASQTGASLEGDASKSDLDFDEDYEEEDGLVGKDLVPPPIVAYDKEDPPMVVGSTYLSMGQFKLALNHYAIKHEFEYLTEKSASSVPNC